MKPILLPMLLALQLAACTVLEKGIRTETGDRLHLQEYGSVQRQHPEVVRLAEEALESIR